MTGHGESCRCIECWRAASRWTFETSSLLSSLGEGPKSRRELADEHDDVHAGTVWRRLIACESSGLVVRTGKRPYRWALTRSGSRLVASTEAEIDG